MNVLILQNIGRTENTKQSSSVLYFVYVLLISTLETDG